MAFFAAAGKFLAKNAVGMLGIGGSVVNSAQQAKINQANIDSQQAINNANIKNQKELNQQNIDWSREQYNMSKQDSLDRWNMENDYNSPQAQMKRLQEGGLNPHLVYGNGATAGGGSIDSPQYNTPNLDTPKLSPVNHGQPTGIGDTLSALAMTAQIEKTKAETKRISVDQESQAIDLQVKKSVGFDRLQRNLTSKLASENAAYTKSYREFEIWNEAAFSNADYSEGYETDSLGTYAIKGSPILESMSEQIKSNSLINAAKKAGIEKVYEDIAALKKRSILYDDQHAINQIEIEIKDFSKRLTDFGISPQSSQFMGIIVSLLKVAFNK